MNMLSRTKYYNHFYFRPGVRAARSVPSKATAPEVLLLLASVCLYKIPFVRGWPRFPGCYGCPERAEMAGADLKILPEEEY